MPLTVFQICFDLVSGLLDHLSFLPDRFDKVVNSFAGVGLEGVFDGRDIFLFLSSDFFKLLFLFFCVSHLVGLFFLFFQNGCILVCCLLGHRNRLNNIFVDDIQFVIFVNFLYFLMVFLEFELSDIFLFKLFFQEIRNVPGIILNSPGGLIFVLLCQFNFFRLVNKLHEFAIIMFEFFPVLFNVFFSGFIVLSGNFGLKTTDCDVDVLDDVFSLQIIDQDLIFEFEEQKCRVEFV